MNTIKFRIAAKTDVGLVRTNNEDNFQASSDLSQEQMRWVNNEICSLGDKGALLVVADGMGGMNAGEVASELAIETIREYFSPDRLTPSVLKDRFSIEKHMNEAIIAADARIKEEARRRPETKGMGTTIVIGWILDGKLYISWCGDSRAYVYNPAAGLHQISKDHSYVQNLIDKGSLTREEAFDFPDSNIITRCLSDGSTKAKPESLLKPYELCDNDIIMLCTDGLSGMIRDSEIESIMQRNEHNMDTLVDELITAACDAEGSDNITICLCQILQGGSKCNPSVFDNYDKRLNGNKDTFIKTLINKPEDITPKNKHFWYIGLGCLLTALACTAIWWFFLRNTPDPNKDEINEIKVEEPKEGVAQKEDDAIDQIKEEQPETTTGEKVDKKVKPSTKETEPSAKGSIFNTPSDNEQENPDVEKEEDDELTPVSGNSEPAKPDTDDKKGIDVINYTVAKGDTYSGLAKRFKTTVEKLQQLNNNVELKAGDTIKVPKQS